MKRILTIVAACFAFVAVNAQSNDNFATRYLNLVSRVGHSGVGVETLLDRWEEAAPEDVNMMVGRYGFYMSKSRRDSVTTSYKADYLGFAPFMELKDSTGRPVYYFNEPVFDNEYFTKAIEVIDKAIAMNPSRVDLLLMKAEALITYEKTIPDLSLDCLMNILNRHFSSKNKWEFPNVELTDEVFLDEIHRLSVMYFNTASPSSYEAFRKVSERVLKSRSKSVPFLNNMGAYYVSVKKDDKKALKYFSSAHKIDPQDVVSLQNINLIKRRAAAKVSR